MAGSLQLQCDEGFGVKEAQRRGPLGVRGAGERREETVMMYSLLGAATSGNFSHRVCHGSVNVFLHSCQSEPNIASQKRRGS